MTKDSGSKSLRHREGGKRERDRKLKNKREEEECESVCESEREGLVGGLGAIFQCLLLFLHFLSPAEREAGQAAGLTSGNRVDNQATVA